jgi:hypothetical protein
MKIKFFVINLRITTFAVAFQLRLDSSQQRSVIGLFILQSLALLNDKNWLALAD